jgi:drug/metabolite transporter (DMT)-like permease
MSWRRRAADLPGWSGLSPPVQAALLMVLGAACVAIQNGLIRIAAADLHPFEIAFFRNVFGALTVLPLLGGLGLGMLRTRHPGRLLVISAAHLFGMLGYFVAIVHLPLAEVTALSFTKPLFATLGAALVLREVVRGRRWSAVAVGFVGVLIVVRPGAEAVSPYALLVLFGTLLLAGATLAIKRLLQAGEGAATIVLYQGIYMTVLSLPLGLLHWQVPSMVGWWLLVAIGGLGTGSWLCFTRALTIADTSAVVPYEFLRLPMAALVAYLWFAEVPSPWTWAGGALIFAATAYITRRETQLARARKLPSSAPSADKTSGTRQVDLRTE